MKMSDQERWAERSVCCNRIHPRDPDPHCWTTKSTANTDAALLGEKQIEGENVIGCTVKIKASWILTSRYLEPLKSSEVSGFQWVWYQQIMALEFWFIGGSDRGEVSNLKSPRAGFLYSVLYDGEENRIRWRSFWEGPAAGCLSWRDIWCPRKWEGMWEGWKV